DNDSDGILDVDDRCPNDPEDFDGFEDEDGCPDPDNDGDGIADVDDACPNKKPAPKVEDAEAQPDSERAPGKKPAPKAADAEAEAEEKPKPGC
ncbi:MAG: thrombospondin, partial [Polyangiaceae bacterium]